MSQRTRTLHSAAGFILVAFLAGCGGGGGGGAFFCAYEWVINMTTANKVVINLYFITGKLLFDLYIFICCLIVLTKLLLYSNILKYNNQPHLFY